MRTTMWAWLIGLATLTGCGWPVLTPAPATRGDLAEALLAVETAIEDTPPAAADVPSVNQRFDQATIQFFTGRTSEATRALRALASTLLTGTPPAGELDVRQRLRVRIEPHTYHAGGPAPVARLGAMLPLGGLLPQSYRVNLRAVGPGDAVAFEAQADLLTVGGYVELAMPLPRPTTPPGLYRVELTGADGPPVVATRWRLVPEPLTPQRDALLARLAALSPADALLADAVAIARARAGLLVDTPSENDSAAFLADPTVLLAEVTAEVAALEAGANPYVRRVGDTWRVLPDGPAPLPLRVYAPPAAADDAPLPLVLALHGAGGDENLFFEGYGAGVLKRLAEQHGFVVVAPRTEPLLLRAGLGARLIADVQRYYAIDPDRIYVLGHSLGAVAAAQLAGAEPDAFAGVVLLAGGPNVVAYTALPPTRMIAGALDPISPLPRLRTAAEAAQAAGLPVTLHVVDGYGHTLLVGAQLEAAIAWLLDQ